MRRASVASLLAAFANAAFATAAFAAESDPAPAGSGIEVLDERPAADKKQKVLSLWITSCDYGIYRLDEKRAPGRFDALRVAIDAAKGASTAGKTLHVTRYDVYFNNTMRLRGMADAAVVGAPVSGVMAGDGKKCTKETMKGGWFSGGEVVTAYGPLIIEMTASLDGATYDVRVVHSPSLELGGFKSPPEKAEVTAALKTAADALAAKLP